MTDDFGNSLHLDYWGTRISRISSQNGRYVEIERDASGRITSMRDDAARTVVYRYDSAGRLFSVIGIGNAQWRYRYDATGRLEGATDPRGIDALTAGYNADGKASDVRVLYDVMSFSYQGSSATVRNGLQQAATFWHHISGLTSTIQDFEGSTSQVAFDTSLRPTSLSFNGTVVVALQYGAEHGNLEEVRSSITGRPRVTRFMRDMAGRLTTIIADDEEIARYTYDRSGRLLHAADSAGLRSYDYFGATGYQVRVGGAELDIETNVHGLMTGFSNGHQSVSVSYNELDQVSGIQYVEYGDVHQVSYTYGASGLRSSGNYLLGEEPDPGSLSLDYDVVGNLTNVSVETPSGALSSQTYVLGVNNQLTRLMSPSRPDLVFEYDFAGKPTRRKLDASDVRYEYDALGRLAAAYEQNQKIVEWRYGPMDVDAATEADDHTPWTAVNDPIASAIFGSAESIAYARIRGTPYGPIRFSAAMARFVLPTRLIPSADSVTLVSLQRRNVPLSSNHHTGVGPGPLAFDKPSNALFLPPEFSSLNCYMCAARITNGGNLSMSVNGSFANPVQVPYGAIENIIVTGSGRCWGDLYGFNPETNDWQPVETHEGVFMHDFDFGNGAWAHYTTPGGQNPNKSTAYVHPAPGLYTVRDWIGCECLYGGMVGDFLGQASRNVFVYVPISSVTVTTSTNQNWYIANNRTMPPVQFVAAIDPPSIPVADTTFHWYMEIRYTGVNNNKNFMNRFPASGTVNIAGSNVWQPAWGTFLRGGNQVTVYVAATYNGVTTPFSSNPGFQIKGENPTQAQMFAIATRIEDRAVMWQESSHRQFNAVRHTGIEFPLFGPPDGWGLMQRDPLQNEDQLWNWETSLQIGINYLNQVRGNAQDYLNFHYTAAANSITPLDDWSWNPATQFPDRVWNEAFARYHSGTPWIYFPDGNQGIENCSQNPPPNPAACAYKNAVRGHITNPPW